MTGFALLALSENIRGWQKWDCHHQLNAYLYSVGCDRVCLLFGFRRDGKTTLLHQAVLDMTPEEAAKTTYVKATKQQGVSVHAFYQEDVVDGGPLTALFFGIANPLEDGLEQSLAPA